MVAMETSSHVERVTNFGGVRFNIKKVINVQNRPPPPPPESK